MLARALTANNITVTPGMLDQLSAYLALLTDWNRVFNLTAITEPKDMIDLHIVDSLLVAPYLTGQRLLDVGSGGGLPGLPLAITHPTQAWTLLDKNGKKTRFLKQVVLELQLNNVEVVHARCEDFKAPSFDVITSRAFSSLIDFVAITAHLLSRKGLWVALKGQYPAAELAVLKTKIGVHVTVAPIQIDDRDIARHVVLIRNKQEE